MSNSDLITCGGLDCSVCSLLAVIQNTITLLLEVSAVLAVLSIILAGTFYISSWGNKEFLLRAKKFATYTVIGFAITLLAFLSINSIYILTGASNSKNWFQIDCFSGSHNQGAVSQPEKAKTVNLNLKVTDSNNILGTVQDPEKITALDVSGLSAENLLQDALSLQPGQKITFVTSGGTLSQEELNNYIKQVKGFSGVESGDRTEGSNISPAIAIVREEGLISIVTEGENPELIAEISDYSNDIDSKKAFEDLIGALSTTKKQGKNIYVYNDKNQEENLGLDTTACVGSGGEATVFQNECVAHKYVCGEKNIKCTGTENEIMGCQCPVGSCLKDQKCVKIEETEGNYERNDQDYDGIADTDDNCPNTPEGEVINQDRSTNEFGCSCSQLYMSTRTCPQSRCEGTNLATYPPSGQDTCIDGKRVIYLCTPQTQYSQQCQQGANQNFPIPNQSNSGDNQQQNLADLLKNMGQGGGGSGGGSSEGSSGGGSNGGSPSNNGGSPTNTGGTPSTPTGPSSPVTPTPSSSMSPQEAFESGNGTEGSPYEMSEKAMEEVFTYNEETGKLDLDKNWQSKLGVASKDKYVKIPPKEKITEAVEKKRKKDGKKELTDEQKDKLKDDKEATKAPDGSKVVDKKTNKEQTVDSKKDKKKDDPSKTDKNSLDSEEQLLKSTPGGDPNAVPQNAKEQKAVNMGLVKAEDGTFVKKNKNATDYFTPEVAGALKRTSDILKDEYGLGLGLTSGYRTNEEQAWLYANQSGAPVAPPGRSNHNSGQAADVSLVDLSTGRTVSNNTVLKSAMTRGGLKNLPSEWWHYSINGR